MQKTKRNDPCPCGSGKKYKKCCMTSESAQDQLEEQLYTQELYTIQAQLVEYAMSEHDQKMVSLANDLFNRFEIPKNLEEAYMHGIFPWAIFHQSLNQWNKTIVREYLQLYAHTFSTEKVKETVNDWRDAYMSIYTVEEASGHTAVVKELGSNQPISVLLHEEVILTSGESLAGILLPVKNGAMPFIELLKIAPDAMEMVEKKLSSEESNYNVRSMMQRDFPEVLSQIVKHGNGSEESNESIEMIWSRKEDAEVASLFMEQVSEEYSQEQIQEILRFWKKYADDEKPIVRKASIFAASLEYLAAKVYDTSISQSALAKKYGTSASSISSKYKAFHERFIPAMS
ncbi:SEC-C metal-binding domain-containing protein [Anaerobacillus sp. 1_MG-2023]|uniref:SEC-C metal-binding domain-containing protein n=1 Tax=Anaerobacillus sp. 1_MG-2023 TaxID=3062655 RepID=UPI0026E1771A|nr:SEC-C metal-binding domain-containing protein [Anaerobacillus sp. 1_MG-2023]MDO6658451.1 SEC-C metal-binding domain-containing protein [Anaerobacillus sp. 1_MG-2023]